MNSYLRLVKLEKKLRYLIIIIILSAIVVLFYQSYKNKFLNKTLIEQLKNASLGMLHPKYELFRTQKNDLTISALKSHNKNEVETVFSNITGNINDKFYKKIYFLSDSAIHNKAIDIINFSQNIKINSINHFEINTEQAAYNIKDNIIAGFNGVKFRNNIGLFTAEEFDFNLLARQYFFKKHVVITSDGLNRNGLIKAQEVVINDNENKINATDNPIYTDDEINLLGKEFIIFYKRNEQNKMIISKINVNNHVRIVNKEDGAIVTGDRAEFFPGKEYINIYGNALFNKDGDYVKGERLIYDIKNSSSRILPKNNNKVKLKIRHEE